VLTGQALILAQAGPSDKQHKKAIFGSFFVDKLIFYL
jgi:hypothetical protein